MYITGTKLYSLVQVVHGCFNCCTRLYRVAQGCTLLYNVVQGFTWLYKAVHCCTGCKSCPWLYVVVHCCTTVYKATQAGRKLVDWLILLMLGSHQGQRVNVVALPHHGKRLDPLEQVCHTDGVNSVPQGSVQGLLRAPSGQCSNWSLSFTSFVSFDDLMYWFHNLLKYLGRRW